MNKRRNPHNIALTKSDYRDRNGYTGPASLIERFWSKVQVGKPDECWPWMAARGGRDSRGQITIGNRLHFAHRIAWELTNGPIPKKMCVLHSCDNPPCCNPGHLFLGTQADNIRDAFAKGRLSGKGEKNSHARLTELDVAKIRQQFSSGLTKKTIADLWNLKLGHVCDIINRRIWKVV